MKNFVNTIVIAGAVFIGTEVLAHHPDMGGSMIHINITRPSASVLDVSVMSMGGGMMGAELKLNPGHYWSDSNPASVLNGQGFSSRYGWLVAGAGFGFDDRIVITELSSTDGLNVYEGGDDFASTSFDGLFGTDGSDLNWEMPEFTMTHHWYAADTAGMYEATYRVDLLNAGGDVLISSSPVTLYFDGSAIPEPASLVMLGLGGIALLRRRVV